MAVDYQIDVPAQSSIYKSNVELDDSRILKVKFSVPEKGVNEDTGILLIIDGFGAGSETSVYKKMRRVFADEYNLVTVQCDYFGNEFMHGRHDLLISNAETVAFKDSLKSFFQNKK